MIERSVFQKKIDVEKYKNIPYKKREYCMICEKKAAGSTIEMPNFPMTEIYVDKKMQEKLAYVDQSFYFCSHCGHGQITNVIDLELQYGDTSSYYYRTSQSQVGRKTADSFIDFFNKTVKGRIFRTIVEIGCNDLYLLRSLESKADKLIGIDPVLRGNGDQLGEKKIIVIGDFFENVSLDTDIDVVICKDTFEHINFPKKILKKIVEKVSRDTLFFFEFPILESILADCRFDRIFHQHLNYFSIKSIIHMLDELGCGLLDYIIDHNHWGSALIVFQKGANNQKYRNSTWNITVKDVLERYESFKIDMQQTNKRLQYFYDEMLYGYGAALMLPVLSYYLENDLNCLKCIIDDDKNKEGLYYINLPVPIVYSGKINNIGDSVILLTAGFERINTKSILAKLFNLNPKHIIYPFRTI